MPALPQRARAGREIPGGRAVKRSIATFGRYLLFQVPGIFFAGLVLASLVRWEQLSQTLALILFGVWVAGEIALFPVLRIAYEPDGGGGGAAGLVGAQGVARGPLTPEGWIQLGAERWRAVAAAGAAPVGGGDPVRVLEVRGLTLVVEPLQRSDDPRRALSRAAPPGPSP